MVVNPVNHVLGGQYTSAVTEGELPHKKNRAGIRSLFRREPALKTPARGRTNADYVLRRRAAIQWNT